MWWLHIAYAVKEEPLIYHVFADMGIEAEILSAYGRVVRLGLNPRDTNDSEPVRGDAMRLPLQRKADLVVLHPKCTPWSDITRANGRAPEEYENQIPMARHIGRQWGEDYIIENVPRAPLKEPEGGGLVELNGRMFGLPVPKRRLFETSYPLPDPPEKQKIQAYGGLRAHNKGAAFTGTAREWRTVIGVTGDYPDHYLRRNGTPAPFMQWLLRAWIQPIPP